MANPFTEHPASVGETYVQHMRFAFRFGSRMLSRGVAVMVTSHLGRPKEGVWSQADSLAPIAQRLAQLLGVSVPLVKDWVDGGPWHASLKPGDVVLLENCRFNNGEKADDDALARKM